MYSDNIIHLRNYVLSFYNYKCSLTHFIRCAYRIGLTDRVVGKESYFSLWPDIILVKSAALDCDVTEFGLGNEAVKPPIGVACLGELARRAPDLETNLSIGSTGMCQDKSRINTYNYRSRRPASGENS